MKTIYGVVYTTLILFVSVLPLQSGQLNIVVTEFVGKNVPQAEASAITEFVRVELNKYRLFNVLERDQIESILKEQKFQYTGITSEKDALKMGQLLNCQKVILGNVMSIKNQYYITAKAVNVETGEIESSAKEGPINESDFGTQADEISSVLVKKLIGLQDETVTKKEKQGTKSNETLTDEYQQGYMAGKAAGENEANSCLWGSAGFFCNILGVVFSHFAPRHAPEHYLVGRSPGFMNGFVEAYHKHRSKKEINASWYGCIAGTLLAIIY